MQLEKYNSLDSRDFKKLKEVFNTKILSDFLAKGNKKFYGGLRNDDPIEILQKYKGGGN